MGAESPHRVQPRLAFYTPSLGLGGVGKMRLHLFRGFLERGYGVDLLIGERDSPYFAQLPTGVRVFDVGTTHGLFCLPYLVRYLRRHTPAVMVTDRIRAAVASLRARRWSGVGTRLYSSVHRNLSAKFAGANGDGKNRRKVREMQKWYPRLDGIIAVSKGVADDLERFLGVPKARLDVIYNPVVSPDLATKAAEDPAHPWFSAPGPPVVLAVGRLEKQKDYPTLLQAFALLNEKRACRLVICGEGRERAELETLINQLGIKKRVALVGFVANPYGYIRHADVLALSSTFEGFGNVLVEAMALGTPVVSTRCPSGPEEILRNGTLGPLVPVGNPAALSEALLEMLERPVAGERLKTAALAYSQENAVQGYLTTMGLGCIP